MTFTFLYRLLMFMVLHQWLCSLSRTLVHKLRGACGCIVAADVSCNCPKMVMQFMLLTAVVHTQRVRHRSLAPSGVSTSHDCPVIAKARHDPDRVLDVAWDPETRKLFDVNIKTVVANQRGVLAKVAAEIAEAGSNIQNVAVDPEDGGSYTNMFFTIQVSDRLHLARIMRALRRIPEVVRISRVQG